MAYFAWLVTAFKRAQHGHRLNPKEIDVLPHALDGRDIWNGLDLAGGDRSDGETGHLLRASLSRHREFARNPAASVSRARERSCVVAGRRRTDE